MHTAEFTVAVSGWPGLPAWEKAFQEDFSASTDLLLSFSLIWLSLYIMQTPLPYTGWA